VALSVFKAAGLYTSPNKLSAAPAGALKQANNVVIRQDDLVEPRRGQATFGGTPGGTPNTMHFFGSAGHVLQHGTSLQYSTGGSYTTYSGTYTPVSSTQRMRFAEGNQNLYFNASEGTYVVTSIATTPAAAGVPRALEFLVVTDNGAGIAIEANNVNVAYRVVWGIKDANGNLK
jgi:hypothetical protein